MNTTQRRESAAVRPSASYFASALPKKERSAAFCAVFMRFPGSAAEMSALGRFLKLNFLRMTPVGCRTDSASARCQRGVRVLAGGSICT